MICAGIDGGQSSTACVLGDETGAVLARVSGPPCDLVGEARDAPRQNELLDELLAKARAQAGLDAATPLTAIVAGLSGFERDGSLAPNLQTPHEKLRVVHDTEIAHAGAFAGEPGVVVIAGTGSVAFGFNGEGVRVRAGGWGYLFGDEGSAFWIARETLARTMKEEDTNNAQGPLGARALEFFDMPSMRAIQLAFAHGELDRARLASFAPIVMEAARENEPVAFDLRRRAAEALASLAHLVYRRLGSSRRLAISAVGGMFDDAAMLEQWKWALRSIDRAAAIVKPKFDPALGALLLAYRDAGSDAVPTAAHHAVPRPE